MAIYFISDLHLDPKRPAITQAFYRFLDTIAQKAEALYILGDFFEVWLGDDDDTPLYQDVIQRLHDYSQQHPTYFMHGNRDFLIGSTFAKRAGVELLKDPYLISQHNTNYLLMHGDSLCTRDADYMAFRQTARSPQWQQALLSKPLEERRQYAAAVREQSQSMNSLKAEDIMDVTPTEVMRVIKEHHADHLIHGHTHRPEVHDLGLAHSSKQGTTNEANVSDETGASMQHSQRIVLGDWHHQGWYISLEDGIAQLKSFDI